MNAVLEYVHGIISDGDGTPSSKRLIIILCTILMATGFIANLFWGFKIDEFIFNSVMYIVIAGMGFTGAEKFAPKLKS
jgi:hypothetical protein